MMEITEKDLDEIEWVFDLEKWKKNVHNKSKGKREKTFTDVLVDHLEAFEAARAIKDD